MSLLDEARPKRLVSRAARHAWFNGDGKQSQQEPRHYEGMSIQASGGREARSVSAVMDRFSLRA